ncbi:MAG TPA: TetR/AcrR family transcriptional regulator [Kofleriaceae bacterium]|jgi:TetR/AcrR family transcriptional repressor of nem operon
MGHSKTEKAESHERIVKVAAKLFRERGVNGIGLAELMEGAQLTLGGFYRHFASRDELVAEAVERALADGDFVVSAIAAHPHSTIGSVIDAYLSLAHRDRVSASCAVTTLAGDVARSNERARSAYTLQVERYVALIATLVGHLPQKKRRASALVALATLVGAVSMARAVNDQKLSREILKSAADNLKERLA